MPLQRLLNRICGADGVATQGVKPDEVRGDYARLEDRIAYSGSPIGDLDVDAVPAEAPDDLSWADADEEAGVHFSGVESLHELDDIVAAEFATLLELSEFDAEFPEFAADQPAPTELVIVDSSVEAYEQLVSDIVGSAGSAEVTVLVLAPDEDGVAQITSALEQYDQLQAVHVVSHGEAGRVRLGQTVLDVNTLPAHVASIAAWGDSLTTDGDILFYGCDLAGNADGAELLESIAALTNADVAASDNTTGHEELGADWRLEYSVGVVDTGIVFSRGIQEGWQHTLAFVGTPETLVNQDPALPVGQTETTGISGTSEGVDSAIGVAADGSYVVVWTGGSASEEGDEDAYFQRFDPAGNAIGSAQRVNETEAGEHDDVSVAVRPDGSFVVVWEGDADATSGNHDTLIRLYDANGIAITGQIVVNEVTSGNEGEPDIAMNDSGQFIVTWRSSSPRYVYAQTFEADGTRISSNFRVNVTNDNAVVTSVGIDESGNSVIAWKNQGNGVSYIKYDVNGVLLNAEELITNLPEGGSPEQVSVDVREDGYVAMTVGGGDPSASGGQLVKILNPNLNEVASRFFAGEFDGTTVLFTDDDRLVLVSEGEGENGAVSDDNGIVAKVLRLDGTEIVVEDEFLVNNTTSGTQRFPSIAGNDADNFAVVWSGNGDGDSDGVFLRTFQFEAPPEPPRLDDQTLVNVDENDGDYSASVIATDSDSEIVSFEILDGDPLGVFAIDNVGVITVANPMLLDFEMVSSYSLTVRVTDATGLSDTGVVTIGVNDLAEASLSGTIWHDVNGDASISDGIGIEGATVLLYRDNGDGTVGLQIAGGIFNGNMDQLVRQTTTDANGEYQFEGLANGTYWTVVDSRSISAPLNSGFTNGDVWAEQTYGAAGALIDNGAGATVIRSSAGAAYGGRNATVSDNASSLQTAEHINGTIIQQDGASGVDFGFSFNVVVNVSGAGNQDDDASADRTMQGTLRQFIQNANAIDGANQMRFVPVVAANESSGTDSWWSIGLASLLPNLTDANTTIDGRAFDFEDGVSLRDSNADGTGATVTVGTGADGWVGDGSNDETVLASAPRPELEIFADAALSRGFQLMADDITVSNVALHGFANESINAGGDGVDLHNPVIDSVISGGRANADIDDTSTLPGSDGNGIRFESVEGGTISHSVIARSSFAGIKSVESSSVSILQNRIVSNALVYGVLDGIEIIRGESHDIAGNYIVGNGGSGIDTFASEGGHMIQGNTIAGNGVSGQEVAGIRIYGDGSTVTENVIEGNAGDGVLVVGARASDEVSSTTDNRITRNRFVGNGQQAIDLGVAFGDSVNGSGIDPIDGYDTAAGNSGIDRLSFSASLIDGALQLELDTVNLPADSIIEVYVAAPEDPSDVQGGQLFGEGASYVATAIWDGTSASITEFSGFEFSDSDRFTVLAIDPDGNTSEFSAVEMLFTNQTPVAGNDAFVIWENQTLMGDVRGNDFDPDDDPDLIYELVSGTEPSSGTLDFRADGTFDYTPNLNSLDAVQFDYIVTDSAGAEARASVQITIRKEQILAATGPLVVAEGAATVITRDTLLTTDADTDAADLVYTLESASQFGQLELLGSPDAVLAVGDTFTQADIDAGRLVYVHDSSDVENDVLQFTVNDDGGASTPGTLEITIVNAEESVETNVLLTVIEGSETRITRDLLATLDADDSDDEIVYTVLTGPMEGQLQLAGESGENVTTFTQQDINDGRLIYVHNGQTQSVDSFQFSVDDGQGTVTQDQFQFDIELVNDRPQIDAPQSTLVVQGADVIFSSENGNAIVIDDIDANGQLVELTLKVEDGAFTLFTTDGLTFVEGDGVDDSEIVVRGSLEDLNAALDGVRIHYGPDFIGFTSIRITVNDLGNLGQPGPQIATALSEVEVREPVSAGDDSFVVLGATRLDVTANDSYQGGYDIVEGPRNGTVRITDSGEFVYVPKRGFVGVDTFQYSVSDGLTSDVATVEILVSAPATPSQPPVEDSSESAADSESETDDGESSEDDSTNLLAIAGAGAIDRDRTTEKTLGQAMEDRAGGGTEIESTTSPTREAKTVIAKGEDDDARRYDNRSQTSQPQGYDFVTGTFEVASQFVVTTIDSVSLLGGLDQMEDAMMNAAMTGTWQVHSGMALTSGLSIGWVLWSTKGSYIVGSLLSTASPWMFVDPLPVLDAIDRPKRTRRKDKSTDMSVEQNSDMLESMVD